MNRSETIQYIKSKSKLIISFENNHTYELRSNDENKIFMLILYKTDSHSFDILYQDTTNDLETVIKNFKNF